MIKAAGAVLWRDADGDVEVAVVHRHRYDDWSLPKGKLDRGETVPACAVREVFEETGYSCVLGRHLKQVSYSVKSVPKTVDYYAAEAVSGSFAANDEVDSLKWLPVADASALLTYEPDREVLAEFTRLPADLLLVLLVRHAKAGKRSEWDDDDDLRPLSDAGWRQATALRSLLPVWSPTRVHTAPRVRCVDTVRAVAEDLSVEMVEEPRLSEEGYWPDPEAGLVRLLEIAADEGRAVVSSQGGVIPSVVRTLAELGGLRLDEIPCKKGSVWVLAFTRPFGAWSTSDSPSRWPTLVSAHYLASALPRP
ncbi:8-oxo-dGTP diphosphatase [Lentzea atacamensis]|uniref:8-oxo-dGTP diphosphatase n=2 Tax=Lentzea TaxID=165301 RepID=A0A316I8W1_9PSEU|nr:8-oxo-dGTP diphosphatase [Lentzea atacamensis]RAS61960.1 8-oxo-dGTP diphosphatase [Lentzea atacamensis]